MRTSSRATRRPILGAVTTLVTVFAMTVNAHAVSQYGSVQIEANYGFRFLCTFAATGRLGQLARDIAPATGIPYAQALAGEIVLAKGSGRCVVARTNGQNKLISSKKPIFVHRAYAEDGTKKGETRGECWNIVAQPGCMPRPVEGGDTAVGITACFELKAAESSDGKPHSVVFQIGTVPANVEAHNSVADAACAARSF